VGVVFLNTVPSTGAGELRASFLQETNSVRETLRFFAESGCSARGITVVSNAIVRHLTEQANLDLSGLPL
jgi:hypothetical protein